MSQVAIDTGTLVPSWKGESARESSALIDAPSETPPLATATSEDTALIDKPLASSAVCNERTRRRSQVSACPAWKRLFDVVGSFSALIILSPLLLCVAAYIKCVSHGPVLFRQRRYGLDGRPFKVWKFRTIEVSDGQDEHRSHVTSLMSSNQPLEKRDHELDVIPGGTLIRSFGIDELPQLINVLKGEMSLVGPRPDVVPSQQYERWHRCRFDVLPGITGLWQVSGKNQTTFIEMMCLDAAYVRRRSLWLDIQILFLTIPALAWD